MTIKIPQTKAPAQHSIRALAAAIGSELPAAYLVFVAQHDGAVPEDNCFDVGTDGLSGVRSFIRVEEAPNELISIEGFPQRVIPLADDGCGNFVYIEPQSGAVFFWDHEVEDDDLKLANDLQAFLDLLRPFDPASIKPQPGQVISAWIDPNFKPEF